MLVSADTERYTVIYPLDFAIFMRNREDWGIFSNFYPCKITVGSVVWPSTEHLYQAMKFKSRETRNLIRTCGWVGQAAHLGRTLPGMREDWEQVKQETMYKVLELKAEQCSQYADALINSNERTIIERSYRDSYWGAKPATVNGKLVYTGANVLGKLHMLLREKT